MCEMSIFHFADVLKMFQCEVLLNNFYFLLHVFLKSLLLELSLNGREYNPFCQDTYFRWYI